MAFVCFLSLPALRAQDIGNCSIIMFSEQTEENGKTNLLGVFSGFNAKAINSRSRFQTLTIFQGYTPDVVHTYKGVITNMKDDSVVLDSTPNTFTMKKPPYPPYWHQNTTTWSVTFPEAGNYCITVYVDDLVAQKKYISVGD
ncbi:MAG: hypothetical protein EAZ95_19090 [Bacteroidetes bacterium]|nr:MAG: hypothetical protein EAZ95_19090 [Bacteroidota bacterium]